MRYCMCERITFPSCFVSGKITAFTAPKSNGQWLGLEVYGCPLLFGAIKGIIFQLTKQFEKGILSHRQYLIYYSRKKCRKICKNSREKLRNLWRLLRAKKTPQNHLFYNIFCSLKINSFSLEKNIKIPGKNYTYIFTFYSCKRLDRWWCISMIC